MGSGIAKQVREIYPDAYQADLNTSYATKEKLGTYSHAMLKHAYKKDRLVWVVNAYTQFDYGTDRPRVDYEAINEVLLRINADFPRHTISMPKIGCGLAGGEWQKVKYIINEVFGIREVVVYELGRNS